MDKWNIIEHTFKFREGDSDAKGGCTLIGGTWKDVTSNELFKGKRIIMFSLPGAFTPTCSGQQLPMYDSLYQKFKDQGFDDVYCISVNDAFVMNAWARDLEIKNVRGIKAFICFIENIERKAVSSKADYIASSFQEVIKIINCND